MKKITLIAFSFVFFISCGRITQEIAIKHNDSVIDLSDLVIDSFDKLNTTLSTFNPDSIDIALTNYNTQVNNSIQGLTKITSISDSSLKVGTIDMLRVFKSVGENEFQQISDIYHIPDSLYTDKEEKEVLDISAAIDEKIAAAQLKQQNIQKAFAKKYNFILMVGKDTLK
jgi:hypothetical protein